MSRYKPPSKTKSYLVGIFMIIFGSLFSCIAIIVSGLNNGIVLLGFLIGVICSVILITALRREWGILKKQKNVQNPAIPYSVFAIFAVLTGMIIFRKYDLKNADQNYMMGFFAFMGIVIISIGLIGIYNALTNSGIYQINKK